mmetsp:Transcript_25713/g.29370  ORF Transcript_25713/g.29370 Transcript_25713/m.29370 type:complete len:95 (+) Transcript_25713:80-364(+)
MTYATAPSNETQHNNNYIASSFAATSADLERNSRTKKWSHSPVVLAMLSGNRMNTCEDVGEIFDECLATSSEDRICQTAAQYLSKCANITTGHS